MWLDAMKATGTWKPVNNKVHIISEQTGYNQTILKVLKNLSKIWLGISW